MFDLFKVMLIYLAFSFVLINFVHSLQNDEYLTHNWPFCNGEITDFFG